jgi:hypothetical protein
MTASTQKQQIACRLTSRGGRCSLAKPPISGLPDIERRRAMLDLRDLFQWERFITPSIIKIFYWLAVIISVLGGLSGVFSGLRLMLLDPLSGLFVVIASLIGLLIGVIAARIVAEYVLIIFRINEHLGAIRNRGQM